MSEICHCEEGGKMKCPPGYLAVCYDHNGSCEGNCYPLNDDHDPLIQVNYMLNAVSQYGNRLPIQEVTKNDLLILSKGISKKFRFKLPEEMALRIESLLTNTEYLEKLNFDVLGLKFRRRNFNLTFRSHKLDRIDREIRKRKRTWDDILKV
ncbi:MAG: hypothetical protein AAFX87_27910 [Bacteroidota bacterium]